MAFSKNSCDLFVPCQNPALKVSTAFSATSGKLIIDYVEASCTNNIYFIKNSQQIYNGFWNETMPDLINIKVGDPALICS
jgi:hypothetical protein